MRKSRNTTKQNSGEKQEMATGGVDEDVDTCEATERSAMDALTASISAIHAEIKAGHTDMKKELNSFRETIKRDMKEELGDFRKEVNQKLSEIGAELKNTESRMDEAERRVAEVEEWSAASKDVLLQVLQEQERIQSKLTDLEARSRRNNLRIFGVPEGVEGDNACEFLEKFIKSELSLTDIDLKIQRCHRSLGPKPPPQAAPRSMIACFLVYRTKELVLTNAWRKKELLLNGKRVYFDHDYPVEIMKKRKEFAPLRKVLKEKGLRFQTPAPAKLRVFYEEKTITYNNIGEATEDLLRRGILPADGGSNQDAAADGAPRTRAAAAPRRSPGGNSWELRGPTRRRSRNADIERAREKLQRFRNTLAREGETA